MNTLKGALRPVACRMRAQRAAWWGSLGLMLSACAALLLCAASFLWPFRHVIGYALAALLCGTATGMVLGAAWPVSLLRAARGADACGLNTRMQTAVEFQKAEKTPMLSLQHQDALAALQALPLKSSMPLRLNPRWMWIGVVGILLGAGLLLLPNPQNEVLKAQANFQQEMQKQATLLEEGGKDLSAADQKTARDMRKLLGDLARDLRTAEDPRSALEALDQAGRSVTELRKQETAPLGNALSQNGLDAVANALEQEDTEALQSALAEQDQNALAEALSKAAEELQDPQVAQALKDAANSAGNQPQTLQSILAAAQSASSCTAQGNGLLQMAQMAAASAGQSMTGASQGNAAQAIAALGAQGKSGSGQGQGAGSGGGGKGGGSGAGKGSTNEDAGYTNNTATASHSTGTTHERKLGEYEQIYEPTRLGGTGETAQERGVIQAGDTSEITFGGSVGNIGESVPYPDVAYDYQQSAVQSSHHADLPAYVQKWVENYFQSLLE